MATYTVGPATKTWTTLPAPSADAWLQPINGVIFVSDDATPDAATAGIIGSMIPYPVSAGKALKVMALTPISVDLRMWDKS